MDKKTKKVIGFQPVRGGSELYTPEEKSTEPIDIHKSGSTPQDTFQMSPDLKTFDSLPRSLTQKITPTETTKDESKPKSTKAERRALQEKQRAAKEAKKKQASDPQPSSVPKGLRVPTSMLYDDAKTRKKQRQQESVMRTWTQKQVALFSHLPQYERENSFTVNIKSKDVIHPAILRLGLQYAEGVIIGSNSRSVAMLKALKSVISDYVVPTDQSLNRHLVPYLRPQISYLVQCRPLSVGMGNAIKTLKLEIAKLSPDMSDTESKEYLLEFIDTFIRNRIELAQELIVRNCVKKIHNEDVIMIYSRSSAVIQSLKAAKKEGKEFRVIVVDSRPLHDGKKVLEELAKEDIRCTFVTQTAIGYVIDQVTKILIGAHCIFSNGSLMSRTGTSLVALMGNSCNIPVIVCCETYKFSERVQIDSIVFNEIADPDSLIEIGNVEPILCDWRDIRDLKLLNIMYDVTPSEYISIVISEFGMIPCTSVPVILREYRDQ